MPGENMLQSEAFWLVLGAVAGVLGAQMLAAHKHRKKEAAHRAALDGKAQTFDLVRGDACYEVRLETLDRDRQDPESSHDRGQHRERVARGRLAPRAARARGI